MSDDLKTKCEACGEMFVAGPDSFVEGTLQLVRLKPQEGEEWRGEDAKMEAHQTTIDPAMMTDEGKAMLKQAFGIKDEDVHKLLSGGSLPMPMVICPECLAKFGPPKKS